MKTCYRCKKSKSLNQFYNSSTIQNRGHISTYCRECTRELVKQWKKENPEKVRIRKRRYAKSPKGRLARKKYWKRYYIKNKDKLRRNSLRFDVLFRDNFTCQYCGRSAPEVKLEVDHVFPRSKGGKNCIDNYKTTCFDCNRGKLNKLVTEIGH